MIEDALQFTSQGLRLAGVLRIADSTARPAPGLVFTGPFTGVKEQVVATYATRLAEEGFATLTFDHRNFGASEGQPRQHEDAAGKQRDLLDATTALAAHPWVDPARLGSVGVCLGTSYAVRHAAVDPRIRALALVAGAYNDPRAMRSGIGPDNYRGLLLEAARLDEQAARGGEVEYLAAVATGGEPAAMPGQEPFAYYGTNRAASPGWVNRVTRTSIRELVTLDAVGALDLLDATPTLLVHGRTDDYCSPRQAEAAYDRLPGEKRLVWLDTPDHITLYDDPVAVAAAVHEVAAWMEQHLAA